MFEKSEYLLVQIFLKEYYVYSSTKILFEDMWLKKKKKKFKTILTLAVVLFRNTDFVLENGELVAV